MATKYDLVTGVQDTKTYARKDAAIKAGEKLGESFQVVANPSGAVVHTHTVEESAPDNVVPITKKPGKSKTTPKKAEAPAKATTKKEKSVSENEHEFTKEVRFDGAAKVYFNVLAKRGAEVLGKVRGVEVVDTVPGSQIVKLGGAKEDVTEIIGLLKSLWPQAKTKHRAWRKVDEAYVATDKDRKNADANAERWALEVGYFEAFMDGAADALAGKPKRKSGAYKDGVTSVQSPDAGDDADSVI